MVSAELTSSNDLVAIINKSSNQNLESQLNSKLNEMSENERIVALVDSVLVFENRPSNFVNDRCAVDLLLDYFCHFDPQIINKKFDLEQRLLFETRQSNVSNNITQPFLLSLFIHQANWQKLYNCVNYLLENHEFFKSNHNPTIVLDFLSSLIHIPELWKGTESRVLEKYNEENVLNLNEKKICCLVDLIIEEMCVIYEKNKVSNKEKKCLDLNENLIKDFEDMDLVDLKFKVNKRVQLLKHFFKNYSNTRK
jgi:hypothetical protein